MSHRPALEPSLLIWYSVAIITLIFEWLPGSDTRWQPLYLLLRKNRPKVTIYRLISPLAVGESFLTLSLPLSVGSAGNRLEWSVTLL